MRVQDNSNSPLLGKQNGPKMLVTKKKHKFGFLDSSGSMSGSKHESAKAGILNDISNCKELGFDSYTLIEFVQYGRVYTETWTDLKKAKPDFHSANGGDTPLYHTLGLALMEAFKKYDENDAVLFNVFSDGGNNGGQGEYNNPTKVSQLIKQAELLGWTVTFVGTDSDVQNMIRNLSLDTTNTLVHDNTGRGIEEAFKTNNRATANYSKSVDRGENTTLGFYSKTTN